MSEKKCNNSETEGASETRSVAFEREPWGTLKIYEKKLFKKILLVFQKGFLKTFWILGWWSKVISFLTFGL